MKILTEDIYHGLSDTATTDITTTDAVALRIEQKQFFNDIGYLCSFVSDVQLLYFRDFIFCRNVHIICHFIKRKRVENAHDGAIVLLHDLYETSVDGALLAMERLQSEGYAFVTIEEMAMLKNVQLDKTKNYYSIK